MPLFRLRALRGLFQSSCEAAGENPARGCSCCWVLVLGRSRAVTLAAVLGLGAGATLRLWLGASQAAVGTCQGRDAGAAPRALQEGHCCLV